MSSTAGESLRESEKERENLKFRVSPGERGRERKGEDGARQVDRQRKSEKKEYYNGDDKGRRDSRGGKREHEGEAEGRGSGHIPSVSSPWRKWDAGKHKAVCHPCCMETAAATACVCVCCC